MGLENISTGLSNFLTNPFITGLIIFIFICIIVYKLAKEYLEWEIN